MKVLIGCIIFGLIIQVVTAKSITKRDCCCSSLCNCNSRPCNSGNFNCNSECNFEYSDCSNDLCKNKSKCNQKNKPCNDDNEDKNPDEVLPVLVPFPQNFPTIPIRLPDDATKNNTNISNATVEFTLTNSVNTVNNISIPISINSTNQNSVIIHLTRTTEYDSIEQKSLDGNEDPNCCYGIGEKCANNQICKGVPLEAILPQSTPESTTKNQIIHPAVQNAIVYQTPVNNTVAYQPSVNNTAVYRPPVRLFFGPIPLQPSPYPFQSPCEAKSGSACSSSQNIIPPFTQFPFLSPYQPSSQISFQPQYQPQPQISIQHPSLQPSFTQPSIQPSANCGYGGQQIISQLPFPVSPCGQMNTQNIPVFQPRSNSYYIKPDCFYQNTPSNQPSNIYLHCIASTRNPALYQPNIPFQQFTGVYGVPQEVQKSTQTENQNALLQRLFTALQQQQQGQQQTFVQN
ncbi:uncharacterized protein LOC130440693 [Diorhabda sublineata]|uniref:uncharacterized protein LOC130440693 n=1 Tax=Diorhabda sublineata TaxID=1163346 RepID=UPI0024E0EB0B|nr:uncharacterized protein LOC130440693 [Diorhabda sublineata]